MKSALRSSGWLHAGEEPRSIYWLVASSCSSPPPGRERCGAVSLWNISLRVLSCRLSSVCAYFGSFGILPFDGVLKDSCSQEGASESERFMSNFNASKWFGFGMLVLFLEEKGKLKMILNDYELMTAKRISRSHADEKNVKIITKTT